MTVQFLGIIGVFAVILWLPTLAVAAAFAFRSLLSRERLKAIERGIDLAFDPRAAAESARRAGVVFVALGIGMAIADLIVVVVTGDREAFVGLAVAVVPFAVGVGLLVDYAVAGRGTR